MLASIINHHSNNSRTIGESLTIMYYKKKIRVKFFLYTMSGFRKWDLIKQTKKIEFFMLIQSYNLCQLGAKILEGKNLQRTEKLAVELGCIQQSN